MSVKLFIKLAIVVGVLFLLTSCKTTGLDKGSFGYMPKSLNTKSRGYKIVEDHTGTAPTALIERFEVQHGDCASEGSWSDCSNDRERSELKEPIGSRHTRSGSQYWYGWSIYIPEDFININPTRVFLGQFHQDGSRNPLWLFEHKENGLYFRNHNIHSRMNYKLIDEKDLRGKWHKFEMYVEWSNKVGKGILKIWINDKIAFELEDKNCGSKSIYFKYGIYRCGLVQIKLDLAKQMYGDYKRYKEIKVPTHIIYYANVKRSKTREGLKPAIN